MPLAACRASTLTPKSKAMAWSVSPLPTTWKIGVGVMVGVAVSGGGCLPTGLAEADVASLGVLVGAPAMRGVTDGSGVTMRPQAVVSTSSPNAAVRHCLALCPGPMIQLLVGAAPSVSPLTTCHYTTAVIAG